MVMMMMMAAILSRCVDLYRSDRGYHYERYHLDIDIWYDLTHRGLMTQYGVKELE